MTTALVGIKSHEYLNLLCQSGLDFFSFHDFGAFQHLYLSACRVTSKTKVQSPAFQDINTLIAPRGKGTWKTQADSEPFQKDAIRQSLPQIPLLRAFEMERGNGHKTGTQNTQAREVKSSEVFYKEEASEENSCFKTKNKGRKTEEALFQILESADIGKESASRGLSGASCIAWSITNLQHCSCVFLSLSTPCTQEQPCQFIHLKLQILARSNNLCFFFSFSFCLLHQDHVVKKREGFSRATNKYQLTLPIGRYQRSLCWHIM